VIVAEDARKNARNTTPIAVLMFRNYLISVLTAVFLQWVLLLRLRKAELWLVIRTHPDVKLILSMSPYLEEFRSCLSIPEPDPPYTN